MGQRAVEYLRKATSRAVCTALEEGLSNERVIRIPYLSGHGRTIEAAVRDCLLGHGIARDSILYVGSRSVLPDVLESVGLLGVTHLQLMSMDISAYGAVILGEMYDESRARAASFLVSFKGMVFSTEDVIDADLASRVRAEESMVFSTGFKDFSST